MKPTSLTVLIRVIIDCIVEGQHTSDPREKAEAIAKATIATAEFVQSCIQGTGSLHRAWVAMKVMETLRGFKQPFITLPLELHTTHNLRNLLEEFLRENRADADAAPVAEAEGARADLPASSEGHEAGASQGA